MKTWIRYLAAPVAALAFAGQAQAAQLLTNGDFDAGPFGFYSAYGYAADHNLWPEGMYDTVRNPAWTHARFAAMADHTPGDDIGRMMVVNGTGAADAIVWAQGDIGGGESLNGAANSAFTFSFWMASVYAMSPANLQLWVNGAKVTGVTFAATGDLGVWRQYSYAGVAGADGLRTIGLTNNNLAPNGNDFALDDMSLLGELAGASAAPEPPVTGPPPVLEVPALFEQEAEAPMGSGVPEPGSWTLMILGFGGLGTALRRRRTRAAEGAATSGMA